MNKNNNTSTNKEKLRAAIDLILTDNFMGVYSDRSDIPPAIDELMAIIESRESALLSRVREEVSINQKGQFEDDGGHVCWYLDNLLAKLDQLSKERG